MSIKKVGVIGRGAVGVLFGGLLNEKLGKEQVCFIADEARTRYYQENPIYCNGQLCDFTYVCEGDQFGKVDLLLIAVKYPVLKDSLQSVRSFVGNNTIILSLLNGITSEGIVEEELKQGIVLHSIAQLMDSVKAGNQVRYTKTGEIVIGTPDEVRQEQLETVKTFFEETGMPHHIARDIIHEQWSKLMLNCGINQICAVYDVPYRNCQEGGEYRSLFKDTMEEVRKLSCLEGIPIEQSEIDGWLKAIGNFAPDSMPSMRQDILAGNVTEVDLFSKTIMALAEKHGVEVPINSMLYEKIKEKEADNCYVIISDSSCDLPQKLLTEKKISVVPFYVSFDGETYEKEGKEISIRDFYDRMVASPGVYPKSSMPSVQDYMDVFEPLVQKGVPVICICITTKFSGSMQSALNAKGMLEEMYPSARIAVVDATVNTVLQGLLVLEAARMKAEGHSYEETLRGIEEMKGSGRIFFTVGSMDYLQHGGRIGKVAGVAASVLGIRPIITLKKGEIFPSGVSRSRKKSIEKVISLLTEHIREEKVGLDQYSITVGYGYDYEEACKFREMVLETLQGYGGLIDDLSIRQIGATIGVHTGPHPIGIGIIRKYDSLG